MNDVIKIGKEIGHGVETVTAEERGNVNGRKNARRKEKKNGLENKEKGNGRKIGGIEIDTMWIEEEIGGDTDKNKVCSLYNIVLFTLA